MATQQPYPSVKTPDERSGFFMIQICLNCDTRFRLKPSSINVPEPVAERIDERHAKCPECGELHHIDSHKFNQTDYELIMSTRPGAFEICDVCGWGDQFERKR